MAKLTKLQRSNKAHERLYNKHSEIYNKTASLDSWIKRDYHHHCLLEQTVYKRKLSKTEKKKLFNLMENVLGN